MHRFARFLCTALPRRLVAMTPTREVNPLCLHICSQNGFSLKKIPSDFTWRKSEVWVNLSVREKRLLTQI
jgi:hypothetical protein